MEKEEIAKLDPRTLRNLVKLPAHLEFMNANGGIDPASQGYQYVVQTTTQIAQDALKQEFYEINIGEYLPMDSGTGAFMEFIVKNLTKLDSIVDAKGDVAIVTVISQNLGLCQLEGTLRVTFKDGALFDAKNSVVWTHSIHGKPFNRFPLTFHDVRFADGTKMPQPSEERMNTLFVGKVAL